jgi:hypothetical protein
VLGVATLSTRNKIAAALALISAVLFIASGYRANVGIYRAIESGIQHYTTKEVLQVAIIPVNILALIAQLGGFAVLAGAFLFLKNHITTGKFLVIVGTGQGVIAIVATLILELTSKGGGRGIAYASNYIFWLATSATGLAILFSIIATNVQSPFHQRQGADKGKTQWSTALPIRRETKKIIS